MNAEHQPTPTSPQSVRPRRVRWWMVLAGLAILALAAWFGGWYLWGTVHLSAAEQAIGRYEFREALSHFERCLSVWPRRTDLRLQAARAARRGGQLKRAESYLAECERENITADTALERVLLRVQKGEFVEDQAFLAQLLRDNHPDTTLILEAMVRGAIRIHRRRDAIRYLRRLVDRAPDDPEAYFLLGSQLAKAGLMADAVPNFQRALQLAPRRADYRLELALALVGSSQPREAWTHFEDLLLASGNDPAVLLGAARCRRALGQYQAARDYLDTLLRDHPDHAEAWAERGRVCREQGDSAEALRCLRKAFELAPNNQRIGFSLLNELRGQQKSEEADTLWKQLQRVFQQAKHLQELNLQLNRPGPNAPVRYEIGMIHMKNKEETEAEGWLLGAVQDDPGYQPAHAALAEYYQRNGDVDAAAYHRRRAGAAIP